MGHIIIGIVIGFIACQMWHSLSAAFGSSHLVESADASAPLAQDLMEQGQHFLDNRNYDKAIDSYKQSLEKAREKLGRDHLLVADICMRLGQAEQTRDDEKDNDDTTPVHYLLALSIRQRHDGPLSATLLPVLTSLISFYDQVGLHDKAERLFWRYKEIEQRAQIESERAANPQ